MGGVPATDEIQKQSALHALLTFFDHKVADYLPGLVRMKNKIFHMDMVVGFANALLQNREHLAGIEINFHVVTGSRGKLT